MSTLNELHQEHVAWLSQLDFFQDEIKFFQNKLFSVILENDHSLVTEEQVAEYRELFFLSLTRIDDTRHIILQHEMMIKREGRERFDKTRDHGQVAEQIVHVENALMELRKRFKTFAAHHI